MTEDSSGRSLTPIFDAGDLEKAEGECGVCGSSLKRLPLAFERCAAHPDGGAIVRSPGSSIKVGVMKINLKPLNFLAAEKKEVEENGLPGVEDILKFCCGTSSAKPEKVVARYQQLHQGTRLQAIPQLDYLQKKIVVPLLQAQSCFLTGNYLATIALCGTVAEMLANFTWEIYQPYLKVNDQDLTGELQFALFDSQFEDLPQKSRVRLLSALALIDASTKEKFLRIIQVRNGYVHLHKTDSEEKTQKSQAGELFTLVQELVCIVIGQDFSNGRFNLNQATFAYLQRRNLISDVEPQTS